MKTIIIEGKAKDVDYLIRALPQAVLNVKAVKMHKSIAEKADPEFDKEWAKAMSASKFKREIAKTIRKHGKKC